MQICELRYRLSQSEWVISFACIYGEKRTHFKIVLARIPMFITLGRRAEHWYSYFVQSRVTFSEPDTNDQSAGWVESLGSSDGPGQNLETDLNSPMNQTYLVHLR